MKVITLWQPWATLVILGWKTIETRLHPRFAGLVGETIGIHAGLKWDEDALALIKPYLGDFRYDTLRRIPPMPGGTILGTVNVIEHRKLSESDSRYALIDCENTTRYGLILTSPTVFDAPIPAKGKQGIWIHESQEGE